MVNMFFMARGACSSPVVCVRVCEPLPPSSTHTYWYVLPPPHTHTHTQEHAGKLEAQLSATNDRLLSNQSEVVQLRQQVEFANRRAEEREANALQQQEKFNAIFDSLRADSEKVRGQRTHFILLGVQRRQ